MPGIEESTTKIKAKLRPILQGKWARNRSRFAGFSDNRFYLPTLEETRQIIDSNPIPPAQYVSQSFDCDDYAFAFKGLVALHGRKLHELQTSVCIGIAWGRFTWIPASPFHAVNWVLTRGGTFRWIEPQNGRLYPVDRCVSRSLTLLLV
jgi:hypothetical protein